MAQLQLTIALVLTGLFAVAIIGFAINFAIDNDAPINIANDPEIISLYGQQTGNLSGFTSDSESQYKSILETTIAPESGSATSTGSFAKTWNIFSAAKNVVQIGYIKIFGSNSGFQIFINSILGIIALMIGLFLYKTLRGQPD
jgi:hypothetical protein